MECVAGQHNEFSLKPVKTLLFFSSDEVELHTCTETWAQPRRQRSELRDCRNEVTDVNSHAPGFEGFPLLDDNTGN